MKCNNKIVLTKRECEVLQILSFDHNYKDAAAALFISLDTIKTHRKNLGRKLGVKTNAGLVRKGFELGLLG